MRAVGIKALKNKLSEYVRLAAAGEFVLVTDRERIVAELRAPSAGRAEMAPDALLAAAVRRVSGCRRYRRGRCLSRRR